MDRKEYQRNYRQVHKAELNEKKKWYLKHGRKKPKMTEEERRESDKRSKDKYRKAHHDELRESSRVYRLLNRDKINEYNRVFREINRDKIAETRKKHRKDNIGLVINYESQYRNNNRQKIRNTNNNWRRTHLDLFRVYARNRRARKYSAPGRGIDVAQEREIYEQYDYICAYCGQSDTPLTIDHIEPLANGGAHDIENATSACLLCNAIKSDKPLLRFLYDRHQGEVV